MNIVRSNRMIIFILCLFHILGFAENQFNFGAGYEHLGNHVLMVSATRSYECEIHKDGCTEKQIMCFTK